MNAGCKEGIKLGVIFESTDPFKSRRQFETRALRTWTALFGIFALLLTFLLVLFAFLLPGALGALGASMIAIVVVSVLYCLFDNRPVRLRCGSCKKIILSNTPWICGNCGGKNHKVHQFSFLSSCEHCGFEPKTYRCHHLTCGKFIFLTEDPQTENYACSINSSLEKPLPDQRIEELKRRATEKEDKLNEIEQTDLNRRLNALRDEVEARRKKSAKEQLKSDVDQIMEWEEARDKLKAEVATECGNDKARLRRMNKVIDQCFRDRQPR